MSKFVTQDGIERLIGIVKSELDGKASATHTHEEIEEYPNLFDPTSSENQSDKALSSSGTIKDQTGWTVTHFIPVEEGEQYFIDFDLWDNPHIFYYDSSKTLVQMITNAKNTIDYKVVTIPNGVSYILTELDTTKINQFVVKKYNLVTHTENKDIHLTGGEKVELYNKIDQTYMTGYLLDGGATAGKLFSGGEDLNNFTYRQVIFSGSSEITASLSNCPTTLDTGRLEVMEMVAETDVTQRWIKRDGVEEWTRSLSSGTWTEWVKTIKEPELTAKAPWESVSVLTQAEYDAIETPVSTTLYLIKEA